MRRLVHALVGLALLPALAVPAQAQLSNMPDELRARLAEINPGWGKDILGNVAKTLALYTPILAAAPKAGVAITRDIASTCTDPKGAAACQSWCSCMAAPMSAASAASTPRSTATSPRISPAPG